MTSLPERQWRPLLQRLADALTPEPLADAAWRRAFMEVPRHLFVPGFYDDAGDTSRWIDSDDPAWLPAVYADDSLITQVQQHPDAPGAWWPTSSSSRPSLMLAMLHALNITDGMRVLEVGTGTGYNAALVAERLGDGNVVTVDIDPGLTQSARTCLAAAGYRPRVHTADGAQGSPDNAPFDRVIATHSVERVPYTWIAQTRPGGLVLVDVRSVGAPSVGHLARLTVHPDGTATGNFHLAEAGFFMPTRVDLATPQRRFPVAMDLRDAVSRTSHVTGSALAEPGLAFGLWAAVPDIGIIPMGNEAHLFTPDGSWATADDVGQIQTAGPRDLWAEVEEAHTIWTTAGHPGVQDYTITVTPQGQRITASRTNEHDPTAT